MRAATTGFALATLLAALATQPARATDYTESINGEISGDRFNPARIDLSYGAGGSNGGLGNNIITGSLGNIAGVTDRDYFTAIVPVGFNLSELRVGNQTTVGGGGSFIGVAQGAVTPVPEPAPWLLLSVGVGVLGWRARARPALPATA